MINLEASLPEFDQHTTEIDNHFAAFVEVLPSAKNVQWKNINEIEDPLQIVSFLAQTSLTCEANGDFHNAKENYKWMIESIEDPFMRSLLLLKIGQCAVKTGITRATNNKSVINNGTIVEASQNFTAAMEAASKTSNDALYTLARTQKAIALGYLHVATDEAIEDYFFALSNNPSNVFINSCIGLALVRRGDFQNATPFINKAQLNSREPNPYIKWAKEYLKAHKKYNPPINNKNIVAIATDMNSSNSFFDSATGMVIGQDDQIVAVLTNYHPLKDRDNITISFDKDGKLALLSANPHIFRFDETLDMAILLFETNEKFIPVTFTENIPQQRDSVFIIGHPNQNGATAHYSRYTGIISRPLAPAMAQDRIVSDHVELISPAYIGNSGSPVFSSDGKVLGMFRMASNNLDVEYALGYAIPTNKILSFIKP
jgi:tetratricopeptide (TPR) repeat protein